MYQPLTRRQMAERVAADIPDGAYVNVGIGMPELVAECLPPDREIILQSENGILGMGPKPPEGAVDRDLINAGKQPVTLLTGGAFFHHADSFAMMRGGHIDIAILGAYQVAMNGDLANWSTGNKDALPGVGGAMDLASGARQVFAMMELRTKNGVSRIVDACTYPLTGLGVVKRVYTDLAVLQLADGRLHVRDMVPGLTLEELSAIAGQDLAMAGGGPG
jgi:3-oxoadipate CoA-transferase beta subunit